MIEWIPQEGTGDRIVMTRCPVCGYKFTGQEFRSLHFEKQHTPADFGLDAPGRATA